jgi:hypothetical protein
LNVKWQRFNEAQIGGSKFEMGIKFQTGKIPDKPLPDESWKRCKRFIENGMMNNINL